ncbi:MAG TPA: hypothetical protein VM123_08375 [archaeon]|nr:hypothetical protein [archaeon]
MDSSKFSPSGLPQNIPGQLSQVKILKLPKEKADKMEKTVYLPFAKYFPVEKELVRSKAFLSLSSSAKNIYFLLWTRTRFTAQYPAKKGREKRYYIANNGEIVLRYSEIKRRCGFCESTISRAFKELSNKGLIDIVRPGGGKCRVESLYAISERWRDYGSPSFIHQEVQRIISLSGVLALKKLNEQKKKIKAQYKKTSKAVGTQNKVEKDYGSGNCQGIEDEIMLYQTFREEVLNPLKEKNQRVYWQISEQIVRKELLQRNGKADQYIIRLDDTGLKVLLCKAGYFSNVKNHSCEGKTNVKNHI